MPPPRFARPRHRSPGHRYASTNGKPTAAVDYGRGGVNSTLPVGAGAGTGLWLFAASELLLLAFLAADSFAGIFDPLAFVGLGWAKGADLGGDLTDPLTVGPGDGDNRRPLAGDPDILGYRKRDVVAIAKLQVQRAALNRGAIADPVDLETDGKALRHPGDHIADQCPGRSPHGTRFLGVVGGRNRDRAVGDRRRDGVADDQLQRAEPAFGGQGAAGELNLDPDRDGHRIFADTRHLRTSKDAAQDFAADLRGAGLVVGQDPARGRQDGDPETVIAARQIGDPRVDASAGLW